MGHTSKSTANKSAKKNHWTYGTLALSMFWIVLLSGVLLAVPFDVEKPYLSISGMMVGSPWSSLVRNMHFWSSQFFLVLSLIHIYDHFHYKERIGMKKGVAWRLSLGVLIIFLAMLTGFLLKGDADSLQARQILQTLAERIPLMGKVLAYTLLGDPGNFHLIYVHHIATFTVFVTIIMVEHSRRFWPSAGDFVLSFFVVAIVSCFFSAPL
ncbi:MAG TPA: cytochrome b N-terminal domain-containing protein, partial [Bacteroidales bacterium]|nr:cytochrome b N-terminal domain-containing protein [Bacteroidales bacterium]